MVEKIKELIKLSGKTQKEICALVGIKQSALSRLLSGKHKPNYQILEKIAKVLNKKIELL